MNSDKKSLVLYCSPNVGLLDSWLPIIKEISEAKRFESIALVAYDIRVYGDLRQNRFLMDESIAVFDKFEFVFRDGIIVTVPNLRIFGALISCKLIKIIWRVLSKLNSLGIICAEKTFGYVQLFFSLIAGCKFRKMKASKPNSSIILYEESYATDKFPKLYIGSPRHSIAHGVTIIQNANPTQSHLKWETDFANSTSEKDFVWATSVNEYNKYLGYGLRNIALIPIPRHEEGWVNYVRNCKYERPFNGCTGTVNVLLISKAGGNRRLSAEKRIKFLSDIKRVVIDELGFRLLIKLHPVERTENTVFDIFDKKYFNKKWAITENHLYQTDGIDLAISLMSNGSLDLVVNGIPTIEYSNLEGMTHEDIMDYYGTNYTDVSRGFYRDSGICLGADNIHQLRNAIELCLNKRSDVCKKQLDSYLNNFLRPSFESNKMIQRTIIESVGIKINEGSKC